MKGYAFITVTVESLREAFNVPDDVTITGAEWDHTARGVRLYMKGDDLPRTVEGGCLMRLDAYPPNAQERRAKLINDATKRIEDAAEVFRKAVEETTNGTR